MAAAATGFMQSEEIAFYMRTNEIDAELMGRGCWMSSAKRCATAMRLYADKYHPAEKPNGIPASVLAIFETEATASV
jgi:hypothetical protein